VELNVPPEILAPRRALDALLRLNLGHPEPRLPRELDGWRREAIGETLLREARA
jgi:ribonuclease D